MFRNHVPERWPKISIWNRACSGTKFHQPMRFRDVPALNWLPERSSCTESVHSLQNHQCSTCDLANFAFGTMVPEHLGSFFFAGKVLFRNNFSVFDENLGVPEHFTRIQSQCSSRKSSWLSSLTATWRRQWRGTVDLGNQVVACLC